MTTTEKNYLIVELKSNFLNKNENKSQSVKLNDTLLHPLFEAGELIKDEKDNNEFSKWRLVELPHTSDKFNTLEDERKYLWEAAHSFIKKQGDENIEFVEPDISHKFEGDFDHSIDKINVDDKETEYCSWTSEKYLPFWGDTPNEDEFAWHLTDEKTGLASHRDIKPTSYESGSDFVVRIAHIDTGYWPVHESLPLHLLPCLGYDFRDNKKLATDVDEHGGILKNHGHGTGTLGILAGKKVIFKNDEGRVIYEDFVGAAPFAEVVPFRISNSVVILKTRRLGKALKAAIDRECHVVSMSLGGVASRFWAKMINEAYENGITLVTASGDNFSNLPVISTVYPARFNRVISACGVTYNNTPYWDEKYGANKPAVMEGNWGPKYKMKTAVTAYTPNIPWAVIGTQYKFRRTGGGTSAATPQIAATAALFLQKNHTKLKQEGYLPWQIVEATRNAIFDGANKNISEFKFVGQGILNATKTLNEVSIKPKDQLKKTSSAKSIFPFLLLISHLDRSKSMNELNKVQISMFNLEIAQLMNNSVFDELDFDPEEISDEEFFEKMNDSKLINKIKEKILNSSVASDQLRDLITK